MGERWIAIAGFPQYEVSDLGRVRRVEASHLHPAGNVLQLSLTGEGYLRAYLCGRRRPDKQVAVHRLVAEAFLGPRPRGAVVHHIDGNKTNNRVANLEYADRRRHSQQHARGERNGRAKLSDAAVEEIRQRRDEPAEMLATEFGVSRHRISDLWNGQRPARAGAC